MRDGSMFRHEICPPQPPINASARMGGAPAFGRLYIGELDLITTT